MQCLPLLKYVLHKINVICRSFLWIGGKEITKKPHIAWKKVCSPKPIRGLNIIDMDIWNQVNLLKLLWNLCNKSDSLWIKWIHTYYIKGDTIMIVPVKESYSWIFKKILNQRVTYQQVHNLVRQNFKMKGM